METWLRESLEVTAMGLTGGGTMAEDRLARAMCICSKVDAAFPNEDNTRLDQKGS